MHLFWSDTFVQISFILPGKLEAVFIDAFPYWGKEIVKKVINGMQKLIRGKYFNTHLS